jgi:TusA-related sulfurtransferase
MVSKGLKIELDLTGVIAPVSLLKCKSTLKTMSKGDTLTVLINDDEVIKDLTLIINRSKDSVLVVEKQDNYTSIKIMRG